MHQNHHDGFKVHSQITDVCITHYLQNPMYQALNEYSKESFNKAQIGRLAAVTIAVIDVSFETMKAPCRAIEYGMIAAANATYIVIINILRLIVLIVDGEKLTGTQPNDPCDSIEVKDIIFNIQASLNSTFAIPVALFMIFIKIPYQVGVGIFDPENVKSIEFSRWGDDRWEEEPLFSPQDFKDPTTASLLEKYGDEQSIPWDAKHTVTRVRTTRIFV